MAAIETPNPRFVLEHLSPRHILADFKSGSAFLDWYLANLAKTEEETDMGRTYVLIDHDLPDSVAGYFTLKAESYYIPGSPNVPVVELAYLARDVRYTGQEIGQLLLMQAFRIVNSVSAEIGVTGIQLSPTEQGRRLYERFGFKD